MLDLWTLANVCYLGLTPLHWAALQTWTGGELGESLGIGGMATLDGAIPFGDPFQNNGGYDTCTGGVGFSKAAGEFARDVGLAAATGGAALARGGATRILAGKTGKGGIYEITTSAGRYVGETHRFTSRFSGNLSIHNSKGAVTSIKRWRVKGDLAKRQTAEQARINMRGIQNLLNKKNPTGGRPWLVDAYISADAAAVHGAAGAGVLRGVEKATSGRNCN